MQMCKLHKKGRQERGKWKKSGQHLDEKGKFLYDKHESNPWIAFRRTLYFILAALFCEGIHHISGANETQQRCTESFCPLPGAFFSSSALMRGNPPAGRRQAPAVNPINQKLIYHLKGGRGNAYAAVRLQKRTKWRLRKGLRK